MPTFCRHNRFIERCPICSRTLAGNEPSTSAGRRQSSRGGAGSGGSGAGTRSSDARRSPRLRAGGREMRVHRELRAQDDGYRSALAPGLHASDDAARLAEEIAFASGRLLALQAAPPDLFNEICTQASEGELEHATWMCFLTVYLSPLQGDDPFAGIHLALARDGGEGSGSGGEGVPSLDGIPLGPRTSHDSARGSETLLAYRHWAEQFGGQERAFTGEDSWTPQRRFERVFERLALPGFGRMGRYELLVTLGRLRLYELDADSLHLAVGRGAGPDDLTTVAAKRVLGVGEPVYLKRRAVAFAEELSVGIDVLDLAFANWGAGERATLGFGADTVDPQALEHVRDALKL